MRFMITGGLGYIGTHLARMLDRKYPGCQIDIIDLENPLPFQRKMIYGHINQSDRVRMYRFLCDIDFPHIPYDCVFHLAASSNVDVCNGEPLNAFLNNIQLTIDLIELFTDGEMNTKNLVFASSSAVYKDSDRILDEGSKLIDFDMYGNTYAVSKLVCESLLERANIEYGLKTMSLRLGNVAGAHEDYVFTKSPTHLIPKLKNAYVEKKVFTIYGDSSQTRDYIHVEDVCDAFILTFEEMRHNKSVQGVMNIGSGKSFSILDVIQEFKSLEMPIKFEVGDFREGDKNSVYLNIGTARDLIGFTPKYGLTDIIKSYK